MEQTILTLFASGALLVFGSTMVYGYKVLQIIQDIQHTQKEIVQMLQHCREDHIKMASMLEHLERAQWPGKPGLATA